jgi:hypothetical protein
MDFGAAVFVNSFWPQSLLATPAVPTLYLINIGCRGFYIRAYHGLLPPHVPDMLITRIGQLVIEDFHFTSFSALTAAPLVGHTPLTGRAAGSPELPRHTII